MRLIDCPDGTRFQLNLHTMKGEFELVRVNASRARIKSTRTYTETFTTAAGKEVKIQRQRFYDVAPTLDTEEGQCPCRECTHANRTEEIPAV